MLAGLEHRDRVRLLQLLDGRDRDRVVGVDLRLDPVVEQEAGLVVPGPNGKMALEDHFEIKPCEPDPNEIPADPDSDFSFT